MINIERLKQQQEKIARKMRSLYDKAEVEDRSLTKEERIEFDELRVEFDDTQRKIDIEKIDGVPEGRAIPMFGNESSPSASKFFDTRTGSAIQSWDRRTARSEMERNLNRDEIELCRGLTFGHFLRAIQFGPRNEQEQRVLSIGTPSAGGYTTPAPLLVQFIDNLRNATAMIRAGANIVPMSSKTLSMARLDADPSAAWRSENAAVAQSDATFGQVLLDAQSLSVEVLTSRELAADSVNLESMLQTSFVNSFAVELDRVALVGSGVVPEPEGVLNATGVTEIDLGGAGMSRYQSLIALRRDVQKANATPTGWIMNNTTASELAALEASDNQPIQPPPYFTEVDRFVTEGIPSNLGTGTDESPVFIGNWADLIIGLREDVEIMLNPFLRAGNGQVSFFVNMRADIALARPASFGRLVGSTGVTNV